MVAAVNQWRPGPFWRCHNGPSPGTTNTGEFVLQLHEADDLLDYFRPHASSPHFVRGLINDTFSGWDARGSDPRSIV
jgi:hypothetical protein